MPNNSSIFLFQEKVHEKVHKDRNSGDYNLYLFKDFSGDKQNIEDELFSEIDKVRQLIHSPDIIYIICNDKTCIGDEGKIKGRFPNQDQKIEYIDYKDITPDIFKYGIEAIITKNKVIQTAPYGIKFKKPSGQESDHFIKASLSLLEYSEICFMALAICQKITTKNLLPIKKIYVDTSSIISLVQAVVYCCNMLESSASSAKLNPQIINFRSYEENDNDNDFNHSESFTIISASTSTQENLRETKKIDVDKCLTLFHSKNLNKEDICLFQLDLDKESVNKSPRLIPVTSEDFSLEYSKSNEVIIKKEKIDKIDSKQSIKRLLGDEFKAINYDFPHDDFKGKEHIKFDCKDLHELLMENNFMDNTFSKSFSLKKDNCIIYDFLGHPEYRSKEIKQITLKKFLNNDKKKDIENKNIVVFLTQATNNELINISQKLRKFEIIHITYIIGVLITDNYLQAKNVENNICFNDTDYKYNFYCYLNLPLSDVRPLFDVKPANFDNYKLTNGFVFYDQGKKATDLKQEQVYLVICLILELLRSNDKLSDNNTYHDVLSPKNFSRFNDALLQLSILKASRHRELNFHSNRELSSEMKEVIMDLMKEKEDVGKIFIEALQDSQIMLAQGDKEAVDQKAKKIYPELFEKDKI